MTFRKLPFALAILAAVVLFSTVALADPASEKFIKDNQAELIKALRAGDDSKVDSIFEEMIDYPAIARDSLGEHWADLTAKQKEQFECILRNLVSDAYRRDLKKTLDYNVEYAGSSPVATGQLVKTVAKHKTDPRKEPLAIDYVVHEVTTKTPSGEEKKVLMVRDIRTADSSLVGNYNSQFRRIIKKKGFDVLIQKMEKKLGDRAISCRPKD